MAKWRWAKDEFGNGPAGRGAHRWPWGRVCLANEQRAASKNGIGRENGDGAYGWPRGGRNRPTTTLGWQQPVEKPTNAIKLRATDKGEEDVWWWNGSSSTVMRAAVPPKVAAVTAKR